MTFRCIKKSANRHCDTAKSSKTGLKADCVIIQIVGTEKESPHCIWKTTISSLPKKICIYIIKSNHISWISFKKKKTYMYNWVWFLKWLSSTESSYGFDPWVGKIPWRRKWQPTPVFLPGKSHGQRGLEGHSLQGLKRVGDDSVTKQQQLLCLNSKFNTCCCTLSGIVIWTLK